MLNIAVHVDYFKTLRMYLFFFLYFFPIYEHVQYFVI